MSPHAASSGHGVAGLDRDPSFRGMPRSGVAWSAIGLTVAIFPVAYVLMTHLIDWEVLDTWVAPVFMTAVIVAAATTGLFAFIKNRERSWMLFAALVVSVPLALFALFMLSMEAMFPH